MLYPEIAVYAALQAAQRLHERDAPDAPRPQPERLLFRGERDAYTAWATVSAGGGPSRVLPRYTTVRSHSPTSFDWGYGESGPAQLALSLCIEVIGRQRAERVYQQVKDLLIAPIVKDAWMISGDTIRDAAMRAERSAQNRNVADGDK